MDLLFPKINKRAITDLPVPLQRLLVVLDGIGVARGVVQTEGMRRGSGGGSEAKLRLQIPPPASRVPQCNPGAGSQRKRAAARMGGGGLSSRDSPGRSPLGSS